MNLKKSIRNILREETVKKFNREDANRGIFSNILEKITIDYIGEKNVCDVVAVVSQDLYVVMVLYNGSSPWNLNSKLDEFIKKILPIRMFTMISDVKCDKK